MSEQLVLASTSPQRRTILEDLGVPFRVVAPTYVEHDPPDADPAALVRDHARGKAWSVHVSGAWTLGVDTTVYLDGRIYAKATDAGHARAMLRALAGRTHTVISGLCLLGPEVERIEEARTAVTFRPLSESEVETTIAAGEWEGRAGAYAIQGVTGGLVDHIDGDYLNVVGLPADLLVDLLTELAPHLLPHDRL
jgi:septum formation protein